MPVKRQLGIGSPILMHGLRHWRSWREGLFTRADGERRAMASNREMTAAKRKRLIKAFGSCPAGWTHGDLERFLDLLYGMYSHVHTATELRQIMISNPFDDSEDPRQMRLTDLASWLEAIVSS